MKERIEEYQDKLIDLEVAIKVAKKYNVVPAIEDIEIEEINKTYSMISQMCMKYESWELRWLVNMYRDIKNKIRIELLCLSLVIGHKSGILITCDSILDFEKRYEIENTNDMFASYVNCALSVEELNALYDEKSFCYMEYEIV